MNLIFDLFFSFNIQVTRTLRQYKSKYFLLPSNTPVSTQPPTSKRKDNKMGNKRKR